MAYLEVEAPDGARRIPLQGDRLSIGRLPYNDVVFSSSQISRQHAELRLLSGQWWIADLHSTNGLQINSQRIQEHALQHDDYIVLAPGFSLRFIDEQAPSQKPAQSSPNKGDAYVSSHNQPAAAKPPSFSPSSPSQPFVPPASISPLKPRSIFSDDEVPFVPQGMVSSQPPAPTGYNPPASSPPPSSNNHAPRKEDDVFAFRYRTQNSSASSSGEYVPAQEEKHDFYRRTGDEQRRQTAGPAGKLLHVCQTCGQLTAPDSIFCQSCHQPIATECSVCRLSLLPIQERCPRCHTPNTSSVRRAHPGRNAL